MKYNYNYLGDVTGLTDAFGNTLTYTYNAAAQLTAVTTSLSDKTHPGSLLSAAEYNPFGNRVSATLGGQGALKNVHYDNRGRLLETETDLATPPAGPLFEHIYYGYAPNGNVTWMSDGTSGDAHAYGYDDFNRLTEKITYPWVSWPDGGLEYGYAYDRYGNRWQQTLNASCTVAVSVCITFDANNHVAGGILTYDAAGNVVNDGNHTYSYDAENRITQVDGGNTAAYVYDGAGKRVLKTTNGLTVQYIYDLGGHVVTEESSAGQWNRGEVYAGGEHLVTYNHWKTYFIAADALGTENLRSTLDGTSYESCTNQPFGDDLTCTGPAAGKVNPLHFTGKERDAEDTLSGNDFFGARYYSSNMGRWMNPDPADLSLRHLANPQKWNKYAYVLNNPLALFDPNGQEELTIQLRAYIPQASQLGFKGDDRGPTSSQGVSSRTSITLRVETDPSKAANPLLGTPVSSAGQTQNLLTGQATTQTVGLPTATVTRDANGNVLINIQQSAANPLTPSAATPPITSDLNVTVPTDGSSVTTAGTVSGSPAFELNVTGEGGSQANIPLQGASSNPFAFGLHLYQTNSRLNTTHLPPQPPVISCATAGTCPK
jgi:RHS repeat-associated protein